MRSVRNSLLECNQLSLVWVLCTLLLLSIGVGDGLLLGTLISGFLAVQGLPSMPI